MESAYDARIYKARNAGISGGMSVSVVQRLTCHQDSPASMDQLE